MPTILTPQGWVKVAELPNKRRTVAADPADALKGPLAYFSCKRSPPKVFPGVLHLPAGVTGGGKHSTPKEAFPYDLNASPEKLRAQGQINHGSQVEKVKIGGKNRTVSAPVPEMHIEEHDHHPYHSEEEEVVEHRSSRHKHSSPPASPTRSSRHHESKSSRHHKHRSHNRHHDDMSSVSSGSTRSSSSSSSSYRSHRSHERARPVQAAPQAPIIMYAAGPPPPPAGSHYYTSYDSPAHRPPPPSTGSARSMSYSWYNATTPLNL